MLVGVMTVNRMSLGLNPRPVIVFSPDVAKTLPAIWPTLKPPDLFDGVTAPSAIDWESTVPAGRGEPVRKSSLLIFFVVAAEVSTMASSSPLSGTVRAVSWLILGIELSSLSG